MSRPISPMQFSVYKIVRENESTGKTLYSKEELFEFASKCLKIASKIDNEHYWVLLDGDYESDLGNALSRICDATSNYVEINESKMQNGGKVWANKVIGAMRYSFLKSAVTTLKDEFNNTVEVNGESTLNR